MRLSEKDLRAMTGAQLLNNLGIDLCSQAQFGTIRLICHEQAIPVSPKLEQGILCHKRNEELAREEILRRLALAQKDRPRVKRV